MAEKRIFILAGYLVNLQQRITEPNNRTEIPTESSSAPELGLVMNEAVEAQQSRFR